VKDKDQIPPSLSAVSLKSNRPSLVNRSSKRQDSNSTHHSKDKNLSGIIMGLDDSHNSLKVPSTSSKPKLPASNELEEKIPL
jgi:hypothetical protein